MLGHLINLTNQFIDLVSNPIKATVTTITGLATGYIPMTVNSLSNVTGNSVDTAFQHTVWTLTSIVAITAIVSWIQKQRERWLAKHPKKAKDLFNIAEEDED